MLVLDHRYHAGTLLDFSPAAHPAAVNNAPAWARTRNGGCIRLNGVDQWISVAHHADFNFGDASDDIPFSLSAWVWMTDATSFLVLSKGVYNTDCEWRFLVHSDDKIYFQTFDESVPDCYIGRVYDTALTPHESSWLHLAGTYDGSKTSAGFRIYVNGAHVTSVVAELNAGSYVAMEPLTQQVRLGRDDTDYGDGMVREAKIYRDQVLTPSEVGELFEEGSRRVFIARPKKHFVYPSKVTGRERGLIGAWSGEAVGGQMVDLTSGGHDGVITGAVGQTKGLMGDALRFGAPGSVSNVLFGDVNEFEGLAKATVCFWGKFDDLAGLQGWVHKWIGIGNHRWGMIPDGTDMRFAVGNGTTTVYANQTLPTDGGWHFFMGVYDGVNATCYVDNVAGTPVGVTGNMGGIGNANNFEMGYLTTHSIWQTKGSIQGVRLYDRALTASERTALYLEGARLVTFQDDLSDANVSLSVESGAGKRLSNTDWRVHTGSWQLSDRVGGLPGEKEISCVAPGVLWQDSLQAYGTWGFSWYKGAGGNGPFILFMADVIGNTSATGQDGYSIFPSAGERFGLRKSINGVDSNISYTAIDYFANQTWYQTTVTRRYNGQFTYYIKGGAFEQWTLVDVSSGFGSNPDIENTTKTSRYICLDLDAGDKFIPGVHMHGVVAP